MTDKQPFVSPPPEADGPYKYYLIGEVNPVRVTCNAKGTKIFTESPRREEGGKLGATALLYAIMKDEDVEEITKDEFVERCRKIASEASP